MIDRMYNIYYEIEVRITSTIFKFWKVVTGFISLTFFLTG